MERKQIQMVILISVALMLFLLFLLHVQKYMATSDDYTIDQQELEYVKGDELYNQLNPLVITFIEDDTLRVNVKNYKLYSNLTFFKHFQTLPFYENNVIYRSSSEITLLRSRNQGDTYIELYHPKYSSEFKPLKSSSIKKLGLSSNNKLSLYQQIEKKQKTHLEHENKNENDEDEAEHEVPYIHIIIHEYNILYIPRHWYFKILGVKREKVAEITDDLNSSTPEESNQSLSLDSSDSVNDLEVFIGNGLISGLCSTFY